MLKHRTSGGAAQTTERAFPVKSKPTHHQLEEEKRKRQLEALARYLRALNGGR